MVVKENFSSFLVLNKRLKFAWVGMWVLPQVMLWFARSWWIRVCTLSEACLGIACKIMVRVILSLGITCRRKTWTIARWNMWSLGRLDWATIWVYLIATFCKGLISEPAFEWKTIWALPFPRLCVTCIEWSIFPKSDVSDPFEVCWHGCEACGFHLEDHDES